MLLRLQRAAMTKAMPLRQLGATATEAEEICEAIERRVPELIDRYSSLLPPDTATPCHRAPVHLERGCLALAAWQAITEAPAECRWPPPALSTPNWPIDCI